MRLSRPLPYLRDLFAMLPWRNRREWEEIHAVVPGKPTVILVSGFGVSSRSLSIVRRRLMRDNFNVLILAMDWQALSDSVRGLYRMAENLSTLVLSLKKKNGMKQMPIYLVAHSAGGLIARYYVQQLGGSHYCESLITFATPHRGTWMALFGFISHLVVKARCLFQLLPVSHFVQELNHCPYPDGFPMLSVYSTDDVLCPPSATALPLQYAHRSEIDTLELQFLSHGEFLVNKEIYQLMLTRIQQSEILRTKSTTKPPHAEKA